MPMRTRLVDTSIRQGEAYAAVEVPHVFASLVTYRMRSYCTLFELPAALVVQNVLIWPALFKQLCGLFCSRQGVSEVSVESD